MQPDVEFNVMEPELPLWLVCMTTLASPSNSDNGYDNESAEIDRNIADRQSSIAEDKEGEGIDKIASVMYM